MCHLWLEGYRWQSVPAYIATLSLVVYELSHRLSNLQASNLGGLVAILLILASIVLSTIFSEHDLAMDSRVKQRRAGSHQNNLRLQRGSTKKLVRDNKRGLVRWGRREQEFQLAKPEYSLNCAGYARDY